MSLKTSIPEYKIFPQEYNCSYEIPNHEKYVNKHKHSWEKSVRFFRATHLLVKKTWSFFWNTRNILAYKRWSSLMHNRFWRAYNHSLKSFWRILYQNLFFRKLRTPNQKCLSIFQACIKHNLQRGQNPPILVTNPFLYFF